MDEDLFMFDGQDEIIQDQQDTQNENQQDEEDVVYETDDLNSDDESVDYMTAYLADKGIDINKVPIYDEQGNLSEVPWDSLSDADKYEILHSDDQESPVTDDEINILNFLRQNNMSLQDFANWQRQDAINQYINSQQEPLDSDSYTDDEIVAYDYIKRFGDAMTDEEIDAEIERLKEDEDKYAKLVKLLRDNYRAEEEANRALYEKQTQEQKQADETAFREEYANAVNSFDEIQGIMLEPQDKQELLDFVLQKDVSGRTEFAKALDDPQSVLKMAWFLQHGEDTFNATVDYFKNQIASRTQQNSPRVYNKTATRQKSSDKFKF